MAEMKRMEEMKTGVNDWKKVHKREVANFLCELPCILFSYHEFLLRISRKINHPVLTNFPDPLMDLYGDFEFYC